MCMKLNEVRKQFFFYRGQPFFAERPIFMAHKPFRLKVKYLGLLPFDCFIGYVHCCWNPSPLFLNAFRMSLGYFRRNVFPREPPAAQAMEYIKASFGATLVLAPTNNPFILHPPSILKYATAAKASSLASVNTCN